MRNLLAELTELNQSIWLDNIHRDMLFNGELSRMISHDSLRGITSNPSIFHKAITGRQTYDEDIRNLVQNRGQGISSREIFYELAIDDVRKAADMLSTVYEATKTRDGYVSIEVSPDLAWDAEATVREAEQLFARVDRRNCMIKVPATAECLPAIEELIFRGINVNATLLFSVERYHQVAEAYIRGLERRVENNQSITHIASVASFFISRVDALVDRLLEERIASAASDRDRLAGLKGTIAIANAKEAYRAYKKSFFTPRFGKLRQHGAHTQRLLWASTGTKNSNYSDVLYIEHLIGPDTINTMPPATMDAFRDHGRVHTTLEEHMEATAFALKTLQQIGIDIDIVTAQLEKEGVEAFQKSFDLLLEAIEQKRRHADQVRG